MRNLNNYLVASLDPYYFPTPAVLYLPLIRSGLPERKPNSNRRPKGNLEPSVEEDEGARQPEVQLA